MTLTQIVETEMTEEKLREMIRRHDLWHMMSDDGRVYRKGYAELMEIRAAMTKLPEGVGQRIWNEMTGQ